MVFRIFISENYLALMVIFMLSSLIRTKNLLYGNRMRTVVDIGLAQKMRLTHI